MGRCDSSAGCGSAGTGDILVEEEKVNQKKIVIIVSIIVGFLLIWSAINPANYGVWFLEVAPGLIGVTILALTYKRFQFSTIVYIFVTLHFIILIIGGHYTYAENPLFNWLQDTFDLSRNYYDRLGHIAQGFFPAIIIRELLLRKTKLERGKWLFFLVASVALAISASYELFEWFAAVSLAPGTGDAFLATQGDIWDSQWDMLLALVGSITSLLLFSRLHDRQLESIKSTEKKR
ncbi:MAG TPA: DUF2238 domain-containing protein [Candidatus Nanoarchaeia archaeon]|nr:DUF2238 domain-containing protein [Candidatus Nanoarchaeia archaeon]